MIASITLQGFKSFADRVRLEFGPGVTAVIGPNGSGKSNVVEAIRWATHNARARELRAGRATELIFHGSGGKAPLGLAEVTVELRDLPGRARLNLARRIYRDGTAEQDVNGRAVRARDVQAELRGTGLGSGGLAVIGQGEVSSVVQAEGRTLLGYLEEAAGLSRMISARDETRARLADADAHLANLRPVEEELAGRVARLERAAQDAAAHQALTLRSLTLTDALARARFEATTEEIRALRAREADLLAASARVADDAQSAQSALERARVALTDAQAQRAAHAQALELLSAAQDAHRQADVYLGHLTRERDALMAERAALPLTPPERPAPDTAALSRAAHEARAALDAAERAVRALEVDLERARTAFARAAEAQARLGAERDTLLGEVERLQAQLQHDEAALETARADLTGTAQHRAQLDAGAADATRRRADVTARLRDVRADIARLDAARAPTVRERERLEAALNSYARYGEGARNALRLDHPGIIGSVADLLTVPAELETAVTAALGRRLEQVVVESSGVAREVIEHLKRAGGRATFLPLDLLRARPRRDAHLLREPGVVGNLADLLPTDPDIVGQNLLSDTLVVRTLADATRLARAHASRPRLVTLDGELLESGGALTGGRLRDGGLNVLADQRRLADLDDELAASDTQRATLTREEAQLTRDLEALGADGTSPERERAAQAERTLERRVAELEAVTRGARKQHDAYLARLSADAAPVPGAPPAPPEALEQQLTDARAHVDDARELERTASAAVLDAQALASAWRAHADAAARAAHLDARLTENAGALEAQRARLASAAEEVERRRAQLGEYDDSTYTALVAARENANRAYAALIAQQNALRAQLEDTRLTAARREGSLEEVPPGAQPPGAAREWQAELTRVRADLARLGTVNARAREEHAEEAERLAALRAERDDAARATEELREHLEALDRDAQSALGVAYARVADAFREYAGELLGGVGELEADRDERGHLTGLRLAVQPRGKRTRSMTLLSAGERTMAGLAFLFALNHATESGGLPLAVLDEVDAPLDEANIRRFTRFLEVFAARGAQFLLVTHQKATMEVAHSLWGVTTDTSGASRVLSIRQDEDRLPV
ncbi:AAA family ATPase [Deinococcus maricopensis]|uniref:Chromosome partition protein Smc n=1 Tax=Deinococcus maricopensis (strain DSM 21211 / LMG 22137 / NRRL B-23946 / LB-34) TaxID=709986 RepID=E8U8U4_DEIML|nr:chromosome segregation SMC family protein [Deinococcus maricopensis]ADV67483.1 SMC domain protein [Deinococcus maricopensis DSM 21211]